MASLDSEEDNSDIRRERVQVLVQSQQCLNKVSEINKIGEQHDVKLDLEKEKGVVTLEGPTEKVINAKCKIHELLRNSSKKFAEQALKNIQASLCSPDDKEQHSNEAALNKSFEAEYVAVIKDALIPKLEPDELSRFDSSPPWTMLTVQQQEGIITVEVLKEEAISYMLSDVKKQILGLLNKFKIERELEKEDRLVDEKVQWSVTIKDQLSGVLKFKHFPRRLNVILENAYQNKQKDPVRLMGAEWDRGCIYVDFSTMRASPKRYSEPDGSQKVFRREKITENKIELPVHWTVMQVGEKIEIVTLLPSSQEYQDVEERFLRGVKTGIYNTGKAPNPANNPVGQFNNVKVLKIERIQNPSLYQLFSIRLDQIKKHVDEKTTKLVQTLWYGADPRAIKDINHFGFHRSYLDFGGEPWHGRGVYFTNDASYMARDWLSRRDPSGKKKMYQARVITGHFCAGKKGMRYPPERLTGISYDCAVDDLNNPIQFIIFNDTQAYPEYCIEFTI